MVKGETSNYLTMISDPLTGCKNTYPKAWFRCVCGKEKIIGIKNVSGGTTKSCGCKRSYLSSLVKHNYKHGERDTRLYNIFHKMQSRCYNPNYREHCYYSDRGIKVCDEWKDNYIAFRNWALNNGYADNLSIDRIDVNKGYSPDNCRWASSREQNRNKRNNVKITHDGKTMVLAAWCEELGLNYSTIEMRICRGWNPERAITEPIQNLNKGKEGI